MKTEGGEKCGRSPKLHGVLGEPGEMETPWTMELIKRELVIER